MRVSECMIPALAAAFKALGDETRLRIVNLLVHQGELCVCDVERILDVSQSKASRHLAYLKNAGLVSDRRDGTWVYYRLVRDSALVKAVYRELKKSLVEDEQALADLQAAADSGDDCTPISLLKK